MLPPQIISSKEAIGFISLDIPGVGLTHCIGENPSFRGAADIPTPAI
jgi:hypothetical protein